MGKFMKIAIDCSGTLLERTHQPSLLDFMEKAIAKGHQVTVWSAGPAYLTEAIKIINASQIKGREKIIASTKTYKVEVDGHPERMMDIAIDDQVNKSAHLAAIRVVHPMDIKDVSL